MSVDGRCDGHGRGIRGWRGVMVIREVFGGKCLWRGKMVMGKM